MKRKNKVVSLILIILGIAVIVVSAIMASSFKRDMESYYHYTKFWGCLEIRTQSDIDVDNSYVNIYDNFFKRNEKVKLQYNKSKGDNYIFNIEKTDYSIISLEIKDTNGNNIELTKYTEQQEKSRKSSCTLMYLIIAAGAIAVVAGVIVFVTSFAKKTLDSLGNSLKDSNLFDLNKTSKIKCEYCGLENDPTRERCSGCGANLQLKNKV